MCRVYKELIFRTALQEEIGDQGVEFIMSLY